MTSLLLRSLATMAFYLGTLAAARGRPAWFLWWVPLVGLGVLLVRWFGWSAIVDLVMGIALAQPIALTGFLLLLWRKGDVQANFDATFSRAIDRYPHNLPRFVGGWIVVIETYLRSEAPKPEDTP